jgi:RHS repeat-associated protein
VGYYSVASGNNQWLAAYVPFQGRELARYTYTTYFDFTHPNALGSGWISNDGSNNLVQDWLFYPWGQPWETAGASYDSHFAGNHAALQAPNLADFTMYDTYFRFYAPSPGRWHSPDPLGGDITNPQSWNRYAYALDNPCSVTDPLGLDPQCRFNVAMINANALTTPQFQAMQSEFESVLDHAGVGVSFVQPGNADYTITVSPYNPPRYDPKPRQNTVLGFTPTDPNTPVGASVAERGVLNYGFVLASNLAAMSSMSAATLGPAAGAVAAHEFGHWALPLPIDGKFQGIMGPSGGELTQTPIPSQFTALQAQRLQGRCQALHGTNNGSGGAGSGGGWTLGGPGGEFALTGGWESSLFWLQGGGEGAEFSNNCYMPDTPGEGCSSVTSTIKY